MGLLTALIYKMMRTNQSTVSKDEPSTIPNRGDAADKFHPEILSRIQELKKVTAKRADIYCVNHREEPGEVSCSICDELFCKACAKPFKTMHFCKEHLPFIMKKDWEEILTIKTSTEEPELGVKLYEIKKKLFQEEGVMTYIETHYKINVDHDFIETYLVLFGIKEHSHTLKEKFSQIQLH